MRITHRMTHHLWAASVALALTMTPALLCRAQPPPEAVAPLTNLVTISATDANVPELVRMLSRAAGARIVLAAADTPLVTLDLQNAPLELALDRISDAAGLRWELLDDIYMVKPGDAEVEVKVVGGPAAESWRTWDGRLPADVATSEFVPTRTKVAEGKLTGTLSDVVSDLKTAGVDISIDPSATVGLAETALELGWHGERNTVEHVLLRLAMAAKAEPAGFPSPGFTVVQHVDQEQHATDRLRVVPGDRWTDGANLYGRFGQYYGLRQAANAPVAIVEGPGWPNAGEEVEDLDARVAAIEEGMRRARGAGWTAAPGALRKKIDLELENVPLTEALRAIEAELGKPITLAEGVSGETRVTVHAKEAPILEVLTGILGPLGLTGTYAIGGEFGGVTVVPQTPWLNQSYFFTRPGGR